MSAFDLLNAVNVGDHIEQKNRLSYLSWAWAWAELKKRYPDSFYTIYENASGMFYHTDGRTCWVKTGVTLVDGEYKLEHIEYLPVMDYKNASIPVDKVTSFDVNKAIQRSLTKAVARHGLGLYIYAGEDLPDDGAVDTKPQGKPYAAPDNVSKNEPSAKPAITRDGMIQSVLDANGITKEELEKTVLEITGNQLGSYHGDQFKEALHKAHAILQKRKVA